MAGPVLRRTRFARSEQGAAMVEFAIVTPLLLTMAFGVIDFGRAFYVYNALNSIVRDGARLGAAQGSALDANALKTRIRNEIVPEYRILGTAAPSAAQIVVSFTSPAGATGDVTVQIQNYPFSAWAPILPIARNLTLTASASFRREIF